MILIFIFLEMINVFILYLKPHSKLGNGVGVFNHFASSEQDPHLHDFIRYLVYWVAGTKLIFIVLLMVILFLGTTSIKLASIFVLILSILTYYIKLNPIIKKLDEANHITPKGYSKGLSYMIAGFIGLFVGALLLYFII